MKNNVLIYKVMIIITLFLITNIITATTNEYDNDWPMYQHDATNTGFSSSSFPDSLNLSYSLNYSEITNSTFISLYSTPIVANGKIFIAGKGSKTDIFALDENNGSLIWKKDLPLNDSSTVFVFTNSPVVSNGKVFICYGSFFSFPPQSKIFALDENTGEIVWEKNILTSSIYPSITISNDKVIVGGHFTIILPISRLYVFDANNGDFIPKESKLENISIKHTIYVIIHKGSYKCKM